MELRRVKMILEIYEGALGHAINLNKSDIMFSDGVSIASGVELARELGVRRVEQHAMYRGIPGRVGRYRSVVFRTVVDRVSKKIKDWKSGVLSQAGKLTLVL